MWQGREQQGLNVSQLWERLDSSPGRKRTDKVRRAHRTQGGQAGSSIKFPGCCRELKEEGNGIEDQGERFYLLVGMASLLQSDAAPGMGEEGGQ